MNGEMRRNLLGLAGNLGIKEKEVIALYGAGGKTTLLNRLGEELAGAGKKVLLTTTTKIFRPAAGTPTVLESDFRAAAAALRQKFRRHNLVVLGSSLLPNGKFDGIEPGWAKEFLAEGPASYVLIEADGAARRPIKGYASFEPVLPREADLVIPLQGLDALGANVTEENIHRVELFAQATGAPLGKPLTPFHFSRSLQQMVACGREQAPRARIVPLINKVDRLTEKKRGAMLCTLAAEPASSSLVDKILFSVLQEENPVRFVLDLLSGVPVPFVSCVVLAAGSSRRMGRDKLFLQIKEKTILARAVQNAAAAEVGEVIVVTRPESFAAVEKTLVAAGMGKVKVVVNPRHRRGIASSLKAGLAAVNPLAQGVIFALGDQPFIPVEVYSLLLKHYTQNLYLLTYPRYRGKRGNPTLFDRRAWPELMGLKGDAGGRQIISQFPAEEVCAVETHHPGVLADIDTPADWEKYNAGED
ncbi:MAG: putative selenium-dependent hydroxylase accessory protein YqeC [Firmicutes bacterium]|mgnify:CR=1 FL=1|nr:putative selenium-dependent hydroxylase accessory protein YqeC [Bacillota bacterium]